MKSLWQKGEIISPLESRDRTKILRIFLDNDFLINRDEDIFQIIITKNKNKNFHNTSKTVEMLNRRDPRSKTVRWRE